MTTSPGLLDEAARVLNSFAGQSNTKHRDEGIGCG